MAMTPIERAARALYRLHDAPPQELLDRLKANGDDDALAEELAEEDQVWGSYVEDVRAVLTAIREPSEAMIDEAYESYDADGGSLRKVFSNMIDAALAEGQPA